MRLIGDDGSRVAEGDSVSSRMFDSLSSRLEGIVKRLRGKGRLTEADVDEMLKEIRTALLELSLIHISEPTRPY